MELYIGGYAQGKLDYVKKFYDRAVVYDDENFEKLIDENISEKIILNKFNLCVLKMIKCGKNHENIRKVVDKIIKCHPDMAVISDEIGNGIVPLKKDERLYRELTGRLLTEIAEKAEKVERITCGIAMRLK